MVRIHREPPVEGPPGGAVAYTHLGARLARLDRFDSCTLYQFFRAGSSTDQNSWPTPNRCGFNSRTAHHAGLARRSSPRSITARRWFDSNPLPEENQIARAFSRRGDSDLLSETASVLAIVSKPVGESEIRSTTPSPTLRRRRSEGDPRRNRQF